MATSESDDLQTRAYGPGQPPLTDAERAELHRRHATPTFDPGQPLPADAERAEPHPPHAAPTERTARSIEPPSPERPDLEAPVVEPRSGPVPRPHWKPALIALSAAAALAAVAVISAAVGFAAGNADHAAADSAPAATDAAGTTDGPDQPGEDSAAHADLGDGIIAADGTWLAFTAADCEPILAVETAALAGVTCTWPDGHSVALGADGSVSTDTTALVTQDKEDPFRLTPP